MTIAAAVRAGKNVWGRVNDWGEVEEYRTSETCPAGDGWFPHYPASRVRGDSYTYYNGTSAWEQAANEAMASKTNSHFRRQGSY